MIRYTIHIADSRPTETAWALHRLPLVNSSFQPRAVGFFWILSTG
jgi:hypothetical protein